jgi:hypothetical protein
MDDIESRLAMINQMEEGIEMPDLEGCRSSEVEREQLEIKEQEIFKSQADMEKFMDIV